MTVLAWQRAGRASGPRVVLVHSWAADGLHDWEATGWVAALAAGGFDVLVPDLPGHGASADVLLPPEAEPAGWTAALMANDLSLLGTEVVQAVGYAEGSLVAGHLAVLGAVGDPGPKGPPRPGDVASLILVSADDRNGVPHASEIAGALRDPTARVWNAEAAEAVARARSDRRHHRPTLGIWADRATWPAAPRLGSLRIPVMMGVGADDERRDRAPRLAQLFHDARLAVVPGDRRTALLAEELVSTATAFLSDHATSS